MSPTVRLGPDRPAVAGYPPGAALGSRVLSTFEFVWMVRGTAQWRWTDTGTELPLEPGMLLLVRPGMHHEFTWDRRYPCRHGFAHFALVPAPAAASWPLVRSIAAPGPIGALLDYVLWLAEEPTPDWRQAVQETLGAILRIYVNGPLPSPAGSRAAEPAPLAAVLDHVRREWNQRGMRPMSMRELAAVGAVSREHLSRLFQHSYGLAAVTALEQVRLARAAVVLTRSNLSVTEVARSCGYADPLYFSRRFRARYRVSPRAYRAAGIDTDAEATPGLLRLSSRLVRDSA